MRDRHRDPVEGNEDHVVRDRVGAREEAPRKRPIKALSVVLRSCVSVLVPSMLAVNPASLRTLSREKRAEGRHGE